VIIKTSEGEHTATTAKVTLTVYGTNGHTAPLPLVSPTPPAFTSGQEAQFDIVVGSIGQISKIRLEHDNSGSRPDWRVDYVSISGPLVSG